MRRVPADQPKIVTAASLPLPRHVPLVGGERGALVLDGWDGYPASLCRILEFIARERIRHVVFLSGDEHLPIVASASLAVDGQAPIRLVSIHTAALYAPIPFANATPDDFLLDDRFEVAADVSCEVNARTFDPGFGFSTVAFHKVAAGWQIHVRFEGSGQACDVALQ